MLILSTKKVSIKESFLGFIEIHAKDVASIKNTILEKLNSDEISLTNCRSQCYDNAAVMAGHTSGVQQRIMGKNCTILFLTELFIRMCSNFTSWSGELTLCGISAISSRGLHGPEDHTRQMRVDFSNRPGRAGK